MGAAESSTASTAPTRGLLLFARARLLELVVVDETIDIDEVEALLKKLGPSVSKAPADMLHYTCRGLLDANMVALGRLAMHQPNGMTELISINLAHNSIGDSGAAALGRAMASGSPALRRLQLHENRIGDAGLTALAQSMRPDGASSLQLVRVDFNRIGDAGFEALAEAWAENGGAEMLELAAAGNEVTGRGFAAMIAVLHNAPRLRSLAFGSSSGGNRIGDEGVETLVRALREQPLARQHGVLSINLKENSLSLGGEEQLAAALKREANASIAVTFRSLASRRLQPIGGLSASIAVAPASNAPTKMPWSAESAPSHAPPLVLEHAPWASPSADGLTC